MIKVNVEQREGKYFASVNGKEVFFDDYYVPFVPRFDDKEKLNFISSIMPNKKGLVLIRKRRISYIIGFGDLNYKDFRQHKDALKRINYLKRAMKIKNKQGKLVAFDKNSPNYYSIRHLWEYVPNKRSIYL